MKAPAPKLSLKRAPIRWGGKAGLDVTIKSAEGFARAFVPTWDMVMDHKAGKLSDEEYTRLYIEILDQIPQPVWEALYRYGMENYHGELYLLCYCGDGKFCHTKLLAAEAVRRYPKAFVDGTI